MQRLSPSNKNDGPSGMKIDRRRFLYALGASGVMLDPLAKALAQKPDKGGIKPISGSWFEFQHHATVEGVDWNPACARFTCEQWDAKIKEVSEAGLEYLVLMATALDYRCFFPTGIFSQWEMNGADPLETVLSAADKYGVKFFIGGGFYGDWTDPNILADPQAAKRRMQAIHEIAMRHGHHRSFLCLTSMPFDQRNRLVLEAAVDLEIRKIDGEHLCVGILLAQPNNRSVREIRLILSHESGDCGQVGNRIDPKFPRFQQQAQALYTGTLSSKAVLRLGHNRFAGHYRQRQPRKNLGAPDMVLVRLTKPGDQRARVENRINRNLQSRKDSPAYV